MLEGINYSLSWVRAKLQMRFGQRGAEMVEYAIVLAVIAVLGIWFYSMVGNTTSQLKEQTFAWIVKRFWNFIRQVISSF